MIQLPRHLSKWAPRLSLFPEDIALVLGPFVARLSQLVGGAQVDRAGMGTPDGYDGIARRGSYDRLLASEWLLHEELPEEFVRRVVSGEHSFLQRAFRQEAASKRSIVLFDSGVDQLGAPRIAHLAALIVLAQRAEENGAALEWGIFQDSGVTLRSSITEASILDLLHGRCMRPVSNKDIERWMTSTDISSASELWFVGAEELIDHAQRQGASALMICDVLEPEPPQRIRVTARSPLLPRPREATLEIPSGRPAVQLLRDPFAITVAPRLSSEAQIDVHSNLVFSADGRKLYVRGVSGTLLTFHIPNSPRAKAAAPAVFTPPSGHVLVAVGHSSPKKRTLVVTQHQNRLVVHMLSKRSGTANLSEYYLPDTPSAPWSEDGLLAPLAVLGHVHFFFIDVTGQLFELENGKAQIKDQALMAASRARRDCLVYLRDMGGLRKVVWARGNRSDNFEIWPTPINLPETPKELQFFFGALGTADLIAYSNSETSWVIVHQRQSVVVEVPREYSVVGVVERGDSLREPFLVAIHESRTLIKLLQQGGRAETLLTTSAPITVAAASDASPEVAYVTQTGELGIYSCIANAMVLRFAPKDLP